MNCCLPHADSKCNCVGFLSIALVLLVSSGCGSDVPFGIVPVHGTVTYEDGSLVPASSLTVIFTPINPPREGKMTAPGGRTEADVTDGSFESVTSHRPADGVVVGRHKVVVIASGQGASGKGGLVGPEYSKSSTTPIEVEVASSGQFLEIKVSKP